MPTSSAETSARLTPADVPRIALTRSWMPNSPRSSCTSRTPGVASSTSVATAPAISRSRSATRRQTITTVIVTSSSAIGYST